MAKKKKTDDPAPAKQKKTEVKITPAKGRPMLQWVGKRPLSHVTAFPAQHVESYDPAPDLAKKVLEPKVWKDWPAGYCKCGLLFHGDNSDVLAHLLANGFRGRVGLVYIDPPWDSAADYIRKISLRGRHEAIKLQGAGYTLGEQIQYSDIWSNDSYLQFMYERFILLKELLAADGSIWLHCDYHRSHHLRAVMDEVFGSGSFQNEVIWQRTDPHNDAKTRFGWVHDTLYWYSKSEKPTYNFADVVEALSESALKEYCLLRLEDGTIVSYTPETAAKGRRFKLDDCTWKGTDPSRRFIWRGAKPSDKRVWPYDQEGMEAALKSGEFYLRDPSQGAARCRVSYLDEREGQLLQTIWTECGRMKGGVDYPTEKPQALLSRIILATSKPGDLVLDCFMGSGPTVLAAQSLGRRWIGCDINKGAIQTAAKRLHTIINEQIAASKRQRKELYDTAELGTNCAPAQLCYAVYRVNDYDLAIQHNEAVNLASEHIGIERTRTDPFFDGTYKKSLAKIIPFGHPLTPEDLEELRRELDARPEEDRAITLVCLGMETAAKAWIDEWNKLRTGNNNVNRIAVIELRTDERYGKFIEHRPASARLKVARRRDKLNGGDKITVEIQDFLSPTIVERLQSQAGLLSPKIDDWRAMVDCVMIDPAYDGQVFKVSLSDVPERKSDLVKGEYLLRVPEGETTVAVKIIDMLGEEVLVTRKV